MSVKGKIDKVLRWVNIWCTQFTVASMENRTCEGKTDNVLIIKIDAIGDFLIWLDSAKEYRNLYPGKKLTLMCNSACMDIAKHTGYFDDYILCNIRKFEADNKYRKELLVSLKDKHFDVMILTAYSRTIHMDMISATISAKEKYGFVCDESKTNLSRYITTAGTKKKLDSIYTKLIPASESWLMEVERNAELIRGLGIKDFKSAMPVLKPYEASEEVIPKGNYYVIFPGASTPKKMWPISKFAQIADYVFEKTGYVGYVCGSKEEKYLYDGICSSKKAETLVYDYLGKTTLLELAEVIRNAKFVISNDTSGIHFAAVTNTPSVCILGEYNYGRFLPYSYDKISDTKYQSGIAPMYICLAGMPCAKCAVGKMTSECKVCMATTGRYLCVDKIEVADVIKAIDKLIMR